MSPVLGYWDLRGIASPIRNLLNYKGVEFEDKRYTFGPAPEYAPLEWASVKPTLGLDFPNLPYYIDGDVKLTQSTTILRYLGRKYGLAGDNETEIQRIELAEQEADDLRSSLIRIVYYNPNYEKDREAHLKTLPGKLEQFAQFLGTNKWINDDKLSYADFLLYDALDFHRLFDATSFEGVEIINEYLKRFEDIPEIKAYMTGGSYNKLPCFSPIAIWGGQKV